MSETEKEILIYGGITLFVAFVFVMGWFLLKENDEDSE